MNKSYFVGQVSTFNSGIDFVVSEAWEMGSSDTVEKPSFALLALLMLFQPVGNCVRENMPLDAYTNGSANHARRTSITYPEPEGVTNPKGSVPGQSRQSRAPPPPRENREKLPRLFFLCSCFRGR